MRTDFQKIISTPVAAYEEGLRFFMGQGTLNETLRRVVKDLEYCGIDYSVVGAVALNQHGYRRFTEDIDLLLTREGLEKFRNELIGKGYYPAFEGATKKFRTTEENVTVEIITAGEFPGDGKPKPVVFPNPEESTIEIDGIRAVSLEKLIELKLASGITAPHRLKDLADVQELIKIKNLNVDFAEKLNPFVCEKYLRITKSSRRFKMKIYHIVLPEVWEKVKDQKFYETDSLASEGFIHCSFADQLEAVLQRHYKGAEKVLILQIETEKLTAKLVEEPSTNNEIYPHIYGKINRDAIAGIEKRDLN